MRIFFYFLREYLLTFFIHFSSKNQLMLFFKNNSFLSKKTHFSLLLEFLDKPRCDQVTNCADKSDERGCQLVVLEESYNRKVAPIRTVSDTDFTVVPVPVTVSMTLMKIVSMEEVQHSIDFQFGITLEWKDQRLAYHNLKQKTQLNALTDEEIVQLWLPRVIYTNTDQKETTRLGAEWEWRTSVTISREGTFGRSGPETVDEIENFQGEENRLSMRQVYTHRFQCQYFLQRYPFDSQV